MLSADFIITSLVVVLIPGTGVIYTLSNGFFKGWRASIWAALGCTAGIIPHLLASTLGLSMILHMSAIAFQIIKYMGVIYLLYMAWSMWKDTGSLKIENDNRSNDGLKIAVRGILINILNPKLTLFFLSFLPQFVSTDKGSTVLNMLFLSSIFMLLTFIVFVMYGLLAHRIRFYVTNSPGVIHYAQKSFAAIFALLGAKLAFTEQ